MASEHAVRAAFRELVALGIRPPPSWEAAKAQDGGKSGPETAKALGMTVGVWVGACEGVTDEELALAVRRWAATCTGGAFWPLPGAILQHAGKGAPSRDAIQHHADTALAELMRRAQRHPRAPVGPDDPDCDVIEASELQIVPRAWEADRTPRGTGIMRPARRADGRWRVAGDELRQTDRATEVAVWSVLESLGGIAAIRQVQRDDTGRAAVDLGHRWRRAWATMAAEGVEALAVSSMTLRLEDLADRAERRALGQAIDFLAVRGLARADRVVVVEGDDEA